MSISIKLGRQNTQLLTQNDEESQPELRLQKLTTPSKKKAAQQHPMELKRHFYIFVILFLPFYSLCAKLTIKWLKRVVSIFSLNSVKQ